MPWLELSLTVDAGRQPAVEQALQDLGALALTLRDADAETPDEQAIFEPGVGETPLWSAVVLQALFDIHTDRRDLTAALVDVVPTLEPGQLDFRTVEDQHWERAWMDRFQPMSFGQRLWIYPWNIEPPPDEGGAAGCNASPRIGHSSASCARGTSASMRVVVRLDPGLAFGTGTHPTTALCLEWLDGLDLRGQCLIDYGCGSGVLAIAALKLGAAQVTGIDNDPQALTASRDNAQRNAVDANLQLFLPEDAPDQPADVFVANILAGPLAELAPRFATLTRPGAPFALSGILHGQHQELLQRYAAWFDHLQVARREDWVRISGNRSQDG